MQSTSRSPSQPDSAAFGDMSAERQVHLLQRAFDRAWDRFLRERLLTPQNLAIARERLAKCVLAASESGQRDEWRLARAAFQALRQDADLALPTGRGAISG